MDLQKEATHAKSYHLNLVLNQEYERADQRDSDTPNETVGSAGESARCLHCLCHNNTLNITDISTDFLRSNYF